MRNILKWKRWCLIICITLHESPHRHSIYYAQVIVTLSGLSKLPFRRSSLPCTHTVNSKYNYCGLLITDGNCFCTTKNNIVDAFPASVFTTEAAYCNTYNLQQNMSG
ncbi:hypothetical protein CEXT_401021 [Caerostris extrusa]|uniref:Secreted protein n=1 Tax=Caerostris extrusa TaxID=172846 RepID=A0AAV4XMS5_CAEEX|nr:hypothetical protein CEXT_401021 [Caerostris extrusa]